MTVPAAVSGQGAGVSARSCRDGRVGKGAPRQRASAADAGCAPLPAATAGTGAPGEPKTQHQQAADVALGARVRPVDSTHRRRIVGHEQRCGATPCPRIQWLRGSAFRATCSGRRRWFRGCRGWCAAQQCGPCGCRSAGTRGPGDGDSARGPAAVRAAEQGRCQVEADANALVSAVLQLAVACALSHGPFAHRRPGVVHARRGTHSWRSGRWGN